MSLKHALLGFLTEEPLSGYDLHKAFKNSANHFWAADQSQIYRTLTELESSGMVKSTLQPQEGKPDRRTYKLLAKGRREFESWLASPLPDDVNREPFLLRIFFADALGKDGVLALIDERRRAASELLAGFDAMQQQLDPVIEMHRGDLRMHLSTFTLRNGILHYQAELQWLDELTNLIEKEVQN